MLSRCSRGSIFKPPPIQLPLVLANLLIYLILCGISLCSPPADTIRCSSKISNTTCTITNSYGIFPDRTICKAARVSYPTNEDEVIALVSESVKKGIKMKVATRYSHSIPKLVCPDGEEGLLISTKYLNSVLGVDISAQTITIESGVTLKQLIDVASDYGLTLPYTPYWLGLTIGGMLGTGAHGSSLRGKGSAVHDYVVGMRIVTPSGPEDQYTKVRAINESDEDLNAVKVSLGVLGIISQITLKLQPMFKRAITYKTMDDSDLGDRAVEFGNLHEFADITWYPSQRKAVYRVDDRMSENSPGNGLYDFIGFRATSSIALATIRSTEETQEALHDVNGKCIDAKLTTSLLATGAYGLKTNGILFTNYPVVGYNNRLQSSGSCLNSLEDVLITACPWDPRVKGQFFHQTTFSIALSKVKSFITDIQELINLNPQSMCGVELNNGILMRYVKGSTAYLGKEAEALDFDITYYRSKDPLVPRLYEDILEEIEQMGLFKYGGLPHWGKNRNLAFDGVIKKYQNADEFLRVKEKYDPNGFFSSEWTDQVLGLKGGLTIDREGCALEGLCICSEDIHCAPKKRYFCRPGKVYKEARVCTLLSSKKL